LILRPVVVATTTTALRAVSTTLLKRVIVEVVPSTTSPSGSSQDAVSPIAPQTTLPLVRQVSSIEVERAISQKPTNVEDFSVPVYVNNELPNPEPENPLVIQTSGESTLDIITVNQQVIQLRDTKGFRLSVSVSDELGEIAEVRSDGAIIATRDDFITVNGKGFLPGSDVVAWLFSEPKRLGVIRVQGDGSFDQRIPIDPTISAGEHTTQVNGRSSDGEVRSLNLEIEIVDRVSSDLPAAAAENTPDKSIESDSKAAGTSTPWRILVVIAILLVLLSLLLNIVRRRR
jgi:hypothetical protein